ncbi:helix-turn-helix transcriptional regulator [Amycolatopsis sp. NPDC058340]|uniref:helix-turn-helix transcriptional regulator n=1 Tax=Amycolatopsis sp. NPDC058340 TaxID=3346453 RepID=UPI00365A3763
MPAVNFTLLRDARDERDFSNTELADQVKISPKYLENVLRGADQPSMRLVYRFSRVLDLAVNDIVAADAKPTGDPSDPPKQPGRPAGPARRQDTEQDRKGPKRVAKDGALAEAS